MMNRSNLAAAILGFGLIAAARSQADTQKMGASSFGPLIPGGAACPLGKYLAGIDLSSTPQVSNVRPLCAKMEPDGGWTGVPAIEFDQVMGRSSHASQRQLFCPRDSWVWGYKGYTQTYGINSVSQLTLTCRNVKTGATTTVGTRLDTGLSQLEWPASFCDQSSVAIGAFGSTHDDLVIQFGLGCTATQPALLKARMVSAPTNMGVAVKAPTPTPNPLYKTGLLAARQETTVLSPPSKAFAPPTTKDGARVYACQTVGGAPCGQAPADAFCRQQGFGRAETFASGLERVHAETLGGQKCSTFECNVFSKIVCVR